MISSELLVSWVVLFLHLIEPTFETMLQPCCLPQSYFFALMSYLLSIGMFSCYVLKILGLVIDFARLPDKIYFQNFYLNWILSPN